MAMDTNAQVLNSWKEVASYMGRGVRTVQRWERELGLPVRRPRAKSRSAVVAFKSELDQWLHRAPKELLQHSGEEASARAIVRVRVVERQSRLHDKTALLIRRTKLLVERSTNLCNRLKVLQERIDRATHLTTMQVERTAKNRIIFPKPQTNETGVNSHFTKTEQKHAIAS